MTLQHNNLQHSATHDDATQDTATHAAEHTRGIAGRAPRAQFLGVRHAVFLYGRGHTAV